MSSEGESSTDQSRINLTSQFTPFDGASSTMTGVPIDNPPNNSAARNILYVGFGCSLLIIIGAVVLAFSMHRRWLRRADELEMMELVAPKFSKHRVKIGIVGDRGVGKTR